MSTTSSVALVDGRTATMQAADKAPGLTVAAVVIQNQSGLQVTVSIGGDQFSLAPYTSDLFPLSASGTVVYLAAVNTQNSPASLPALAVATWYGPDELPPNAAYPSTISAPAAAVAAATATQLLASGVPIVSSSAQLWSGSLNVNGQSPIFDVSTYSTLDVEVINYAGTGSDRMALALAWNPFQLDYQRLWFHDANAYGGFPGDLMWRLPVLGETVTILFYSSNAAAHVNILATGSTRPLPGGQRTVNTVDGRRFLLDTGAIALAAGASSAVFYVPPVSRRVSVRVNQSVAGVQLAVNGLYAPAGGGFGTQPVYFPQGDGVGQIREQFDIPSVGLEVQLVNNDAAAHTCHGYIWDVS